MTATITTADRLELLDLHGRFCHAVDAADVEQWLSVFARDGTIVTGGVEWTGREGLAEFIAKNGGIGLHLVTNVVLEPAANGATGRCNVLFSRRPAEGDAPAISFLGTYVDAYVREDGAWKIYHREVAPAFRAD